MQAFTSAIQLAGAVGLYRSRSKAFGPCGFQHARMHHEDADDLHRKQSDTTNQDGAGCERRVKP